MYRPYQELQKRKEQEKLRRQLLIEVFPMLLIAGIMACIIVLAAG
jgi:hypothetical protein